MSEDFRGKQQAFSYEAMIGTVQRLAEEIASRHSVDVIVFIHRGGMVPARYFAKHLDVRRVYGVGLQSYTDRQRGELHMYQELPPELESSGTVLIVDDIVDSGSSLELTVKHLTERGVGDIATCVLHKKTDCSIEPDYCGHVVDRDIWIAYDWE